jgi:hypothetical protein
MRALDRYTHRGLWALVVWAVLLFYATFTHQPPYMTRFGDWSRYVTQASFLVGHLVGSILGAAIGILGFVCLSVLLVERGAPRLGLWALITAVVGAVFTTAIFGVAAFAQPAIGRAYLAGHTDVVALYDDVNGAPLLLMALTGVLALSTGLILYGIAVIRTRLAPRWAGLALAVGGPLFAIVGVVLADIVQSIGAVLLTIGAAGVAWAQRQISVPAPD